MSSSTGDPSKKMTWYRSMMAKFDRQNKLLNIEKRKNTPKVTGKDRRKQKMEDVVAGK